jgi:hypothetical protein
MEASDYIAGLALAVSMFTFYWTSLRDKKAFYLVRIQSYSMRLNPEFALINAGNTDLLVTSILCAFEDESGKGWYAPEILSLGETGTSFSIPAGKSFHCKVEFLQKDMNEDLAKGGRFEKHEALNSLELYYKKMKVIVEWVNSKGEEFQAEAKISEYGFRKDGAIGMFGPLDKKHNLYKIIS